MTSQIRINKQVVDSWSTGSSFEGSKKGLTKRASIVWQHRNFPISQGAQHLRLTENGHHVEILHVSAILANMQTYEHIRKKNIKEVPGVSWMKYPARHSQSPHGTKDIAPLTVSARGTLVIARCACIKLLTMSPATRPRTTCIKCYSIFSGPPSIISLLKRNPIK